MNRVVLSAAFILAAVASAQEARLSGTVSDTSGAAVPSVNISALQLDRRVTFQTQTGPEGRFLLPKLPIGTYQIKAEHQGFKTAIQDGIALTTAADVLLNLTLGGGASRSR